MKKKLRWKKIIVAIALVLFFIAIIPFCTRGIKAKPQLCVLKTSSFDKAKKNLKVMTFNIAHGRKDNFSQITQSKQSIQNTLDSIARFLKRENPDVVALQEADGPSIWSGNFNHVRYLTQKSFMAYCVRGEHVKGLGLSYGTALVSVIPLRQPFSFTFSPSWPTFSKGFVVGTIEWPKRVPGKSNTKVDVVSVHLDFLRASIRKQQVQEMIAVLSKRKGKRIVMGDFNCQWNDQEKLLQTLTKKLQLIAYKAETPMTTFAMLKKRIDWILISQDLKFISYKVLPDVLSDHYAVLAEVAIRN